MIRRVIGFISCLIGVIIVLGAVGRGDYQDVLIYSGQRPVDMFSSSDEITLYVIGAFVASIGALFITWSKKIPQVWPRRRRGIRYRSFR